MAIQAAQFFDPLPIGKRQFVIVGITLLAMVLDGLDLQLLAFSAPEILREWHLSKADFGPILAAAPIGMIPGSFLGGVLGDRFGRKPVLIACTALFGLSTLALAYAPGVTGLLVLRFISGIGFGGALPNATTLAIEWLPRRARAQTAALMPVAVPMGGTLGSLAAIWLLPQFGWRGCFAIFGVLSLAALVAEGLLLSESVTMMLRDGRDARARAALRRVLGHDRAEAAFDRVMTAAAPGPGATATRIRAPLRAGFRGYGRLARGSCLGLFTIGGVANAFVNWTPVILTSAGMNLADALKGSLAFSLCSLTAAFSAPFLMRRYGSRTGLMVCLGITAVAVILVAALVGHAVGDLKYLVIGGIGLAGLGASTAISTNYAIMSTGYPDEVRATGVGLGAASVRSGTIAVVVSGGFLLSWGGKEATPLFAALLVLLCGSVIAAFVIDRHVAPSRKPTALGPQAGDGRIALAEAGSPAG